MLTLAQTSAKEEANWQSALPGVVMRHRLGPAGVAQGPAPVHSITLSVVTDPPVENSPTTRRSPTVCAPVKLVVAPDVTQLTDGSASSQYPRSPAPLFAKRSKPPKISRWPFLGPANV